MPIDVTTVKIQSLRLPPGWVTIKHDFFEVDPNFKQKTVGLEGFLFEHFFDDELFVAIHLPSGLLIDLGWKPPFREEGRFRLILLKPSKFPESYSWPIDGADYDWENPIESFESKDRKQIVEKIEQIAEKIRIDGYSDS